METILEYRKGILFIRLIGKLINKEVRELEDKVNEIIGDNEIKNVVINMKYVDEIDIKGINALYYIYELSSKNNGTVLVCDLDRLVRDKLKHSRIFNYINEISSELEAFNLIRI